MNDAKKTKKQLIEELAEARAREEALRKAHDGLEIRVEERTAELAQANKGLQAEVTERKRAEEALAEERNLLRTLIDNLPDFVYVKDATGRYQVNNLAHARHLGFETPEEFCGKTAFEIFPPHLAEKFYADDLRVLQTGQAVIDREEPGVGRTPGTEVLNLTTKVPLRDDTGKIVGLVGITRDITKHKQVEEALQKAYEEMEERVEERTAELQREIAERERLQQEVIEAQKRAIQELSTPIIPVMDRIIIMPLIGSIDTLRAKDIMRALLAGIREHRAKVVILDITGVPIVDSGVANNLNKTIQAARLKGAQTIVTGIADAVAEAIVDLGIDWSGIETLSDLQTGLIAALSSLGIEPTR